MCLRPGYPTTSPEMGSRSQSCAFPAPRQFPKGRMSAGPSRMGPSTLTQPWHIISKSMCPQIMPTYLPIATREGTGPSPSQSSFRGWPRLLAQLAWNLYKAMGSESALLSSISCGACLSMSWRWRAIVPVTPSLCTSENMHRSSTHIFRQPLQCMTHSHTGWCQPCSKTW